MVTKGCSIASYAARLTVTPIARITVQPISQAVCEGGTANFTITATGANLTYQWQTFELPGLISTVLPAQPIA